MTIDKNIRQALAQLTETRTEGDSVRVAVPCLLPDGALAAVAIRAENGGYVVSDERGAYRHLLSLGIAHHVSHDKRAVEIAAEMGVIWSDGEFLVNAVSDSALAAAIAVVANSGQRWANEIAGRQRIEIELELSERVRERVAVVFRNRAIRHEVEIIGDSTRRYRVDTVVELGKRQLLIESVTSHPNALAATFLKFSDLGKARPADLRESVVSRLAEWKAEDLNILSEVSTGVSDIETGLKGWSQKYAA